MSTALLDEVRETGRDERELVLDPVTRQRLEVASCAVATLEELADTGAWERLDPTLSAHLADHAKRLCGFLERVRHLPAVRECEQEMLAVRRTERRLEVALDLLVEEELEEEAEARPRVRKKRGRSGEELFLGDFTDKQLTDEQLTQVRQRREKRKEARRLLSPRAKRILLYVTGCVFMTVSSVFMVAVGALQGGPKNGAAQPPAAEPMAVNAYLEDLQVFLPAKMMAEQGGTAIVMVKREWLLRPHGQRQVDADGAHVYLQNRAIPRLELLWEDGGRIGRAERDAHFVFDDDIAGPRNRPDPEPSGEAGGDAGFTPPGLTPPPAP